MLWIGITLVIFFVMIILLLPIAQKTKEIEGLKNSIIRSQKTNNQNSIHSVVVISNAHNRHSDDPLSKQSQLQSNSMHVKAHELQEKNATHSKTVISLISVTSMFLAVLLYLNIGAPTIPDYPYASRYNSFYGMIPKDRVDDHDSRINNLLMQLKNNPDDPSIWIGLAQAFMREKKYKEAQRAYLQIYKLTADPRANLEYAEALVLQNKTAVPPEALKIFNKVLNENPLDLKSRFYIGFALLQQNQIEKALQIWVDLIFLSRENSPWVPIIRSKIRKIAEKEKINYDDLTPSLEALNILERIERATN